MITDSFDIITEPVITPGDCYGPPQRLCDTCLVIFSSEIHAHLLERFPCHVAGEIRACNGVTPIYLFPWAGKKVAFYLSHVGSALASTDVIDAHHLTGAVKFVMFGSAGALNQAITAGKYVVPTAAYRDEGMSYHYAPPADYIEIPGGDRVEAVFAALRVPYVRGRVWTTDAFYRETRGQMTQRVAEGCLAVDMELAGVQAVCDFHGLQLYPFLQTGDVLDLPEYDHTGLHAANHDLQKLDLALEIVKQI